MKSSEIASNSSGEAAIERCRWKNFPKYSSGHARTVSRTVFQVTRLTRLSTHTHTISLSRSVSQSHSHVQVTPAPITRNTQTHLHMHSHIMIRTYTHYPLSHAHVSYERISPFSFSFSSSSSFSFSSSSSCAYPCSYSYTYTYTHSPTHSCTHTHTHFLIHTYTHTDTCTHKHTHTHTLTYLMRVRHQFCSQDNSHLLFLEDSSFPPEQCHLHMLKLKLKLKLLRGLSNFQLNNAPAAYTEISYGWAAFNLKSHEFRIMLHNYRIAWQHWDRIIGSKNNYPILASIRHSHVLTVIVSPLRWQDRKTQFLNEYIGYIRNT